MTSTENHSEIIIIKKDCKGYVPMSAVSVYTCQICICQVH